MEGKVSGRHEIDRTQSLDYPAVMRAIKATGFRGFIGHEFLPTRDPLTSLREASPLGPELLRVEGLGRGNALHDIDLRLHEGEILALAGLVVSRIAAARA